MPYRTSAAKMTLFVHMCGVAQAACTPCGVFAHQSSVTPAMREMLVDWMFELVVHFHFQTETFLLAVNYLDRWLQRSSASLRACMCTLGDCTVHW
jgi:hypothetical protein